MKAERIQSHLNTTRRKACIALAIIRGQLDPLKYPLHFPATYKWANGCYNPLPAKDCKLSALNELFDMHGVEAIRTKWWSRYYRDCIAEYLNTGESYAPTLLLDHKRGKWLLTSYGDFVESLPETAEE